MLAEINWTPETIVAVGFFGTMVCVVLGGLWYKLSVITSENELKRSMVERGMSADEIERILAARSPDRKN
jgi:hypothetical protein